MYKLVLLRHGESVWNKENRFTGWIDVGLSDTRGGRGQVQAGRILAQEGLRLRRGLHLHVEAGHQDPVAGPGGDGPDVDAGARIAGGSTNAITGPCRA